MTQLCQCLQSSSSRLVTLTGPGGSGKTRLALEAAKRLSEPFHGAVWFVPVQALSDPHLIPEQVLDALRLPRDPRTDSLVQVCAFFAGQPSLLILDNFEHLVTGGAPIIEDLLARTPWLTCLITSRVRLELPGERVFPIPLLPVPEESGRVLAASSSSLAGAEQPVDPDRIATVPSVQLFVDRAQAVRSDFLLTPSNAAAVVQLCRKLEGLPLALELAAARAGVLTPGQILDRLERRFDLLVRRGPSADARHQSLWAALEWSYQLLAPEVRQFLAALSVFCGGCTLEAAEAVCREPCALDYLTELQACSLVEADTCSEKPTDGEMRYHLLETIREFAEAQLLQCGGTEAVRQRHAKYFYALVERFYGSVERLALEHDNVRAALGWSLEAGEAQHSLPALFLLGWFWNRRGHLEEGLRWVTRVLGLPTAAPRSMKRAVALMRAGELAQSMGDLGGARSYLEESLAICRERVRDESPAEEAEGVWKALPARWGIGESLRILGHISLSQGDYPSASAHLEEVLALFRQMGRQCEVSDTLMTLAGAVRGSGDYMRAAGLYRESIALYEELGRGGWLVAVPRRELGHSLFFLGEHAGAASFLGQSLQVFASQGHRLCVPWCLCGLAGIALVAGDAPRSARLLGAAEALLDSIGGVLTAVERAEHQRYVAAVQGALDPAEFAQAWSKGRETSWEGAITEALEAASYPKD